MTLQHPFAIGLAIVATMMAQRMSAQTQAQPDECGLASVYSSESEETASGEDTVAALFTAAHRSLPFGTMVKVVNQENGHSAEVRITDRGPFISGRIIDVSRIAARELGFSDLTPVCLIVLPATKTKSSDQN